MSGGFKLQCIRNCHNLVTLVLLLVSSVNDRALTFAFFCHADRNRRLSTALCVSVAVAVRFLQLVILDGNERSGFQFDDRLTSCCHATSMLSTAAAACRYGRDRSGSRCCCCSASRRHAATAANQELRRKSGTQINQAVYCEIETGMQMG